MASLPVAATVLLRFQRKEASILKITSTIKQKAEAL